MPKQEDTTSRQKEAAGTAFLNEHFNQLAVSREAWRAVDKLERKSGSLITLEESRTNKRAKDAQLRPDERIARLLSRYERLVSLVPKNAGRETGRARLELLLLKKSVIDTSDQKLVEKIARALYASETTVAIERGQGPLDAPFDQVKESYIKLVHKKHQAQKKSLTKWLSYLGTNDAQYPAWFRYLAVGCVLKMGEFDRDVPKFGNRSKDTTAAFPELNAEALGFVFKVISEPSSAKVPKTEDLIAPFRAALASKSFSALYAVALVEFGWRIDCSRIEGEWRRYDQGSEPEILERDLEGKGTGWCSATGAAPQHLLDGDFHVYYTKDEKGECTVPRVAIRMEDDEIREIRGIARGQELEPQFIEVVEQKGQGLPGYKQFQVASANMKRLTEIDSRCFERDADGKIVQQICPEPSLSPEDLRFLYEFESDIVGFGYERDPRIAEIRQSRTDQVRDYAAALGVGIEQVALEKSEITENTRVYVERESYNSYDDDYDDDYDDLSDYCDLDDILERIQNPIAIYFKNGFLRRVAKIPAGVAFYGDVKCGNSLTTISEGVVFHKAVDFSNCPNLESISKGVIFHQSVDFRSCHDLTGIQEGSMFHGHAAFDGCDSLARVSEGVIFHHNVTFRGCARLENIMKGVVFNGDVSFKGCRSLKLIPAGMVFHGKAEFSGCNRLATISKEVVFNGHAAFNGCSRLATIAEGVIFHKDVNFSQCTRLANIMKGVGFSGNVSFEGCESLRLIPAGVVFRGSAEFTRCGLLDTIAEGVIFHKDVSFSECIRLANIMKGVGFSGNVSFEGCESLRLIPAGVVFRGSAEFTRCNRLATISEEVVFNGHAAFKGCSELAAIAEGVIFHKDVSFEGCGSLRLIPAGVIFRGSAEFTHCDLLATIAEGVIFHGDVSFEGCGSLGSIPAGVVFRGSAEFTDCDLLATIAEGVIFHKDVSFSECTRLTNIMKGVGFAGNVLFDQCPLESIGDGVSFAKRAHFSDCWGLTAIGDGVSFGEQATFDNCTSLSSIGRGSLFKGGAIFRHCDSLASIGDGVSFGDVATFVRCTALSSIGGRVKFRGGAVFRDCTALAKSPAGARREFSHVKHLWHWGLRTTLAQLSPEVRQELKRLEPIGAWARERAKGLFSWLEQAKRRA